MSKDRNAIARDEFAQAQQRLQMERARDEFALAVAAGKVGLIDKLNRRLSEGAIVLWSQPVGHRFHEIVRIEGDKDPNNPPGVVRVTIIQEATLLYDPRRPVGDLLVVAQKGAILGEPLAEQVAPPAPPASTESEATDHGEPEQQVSEPRISEPAAAVDGAPGVKVDEGV